MKTLLGLAILIASAGASFADTCVVSSGDPGYVAGQTRSQSCSLTGRVRIDSGLSLSNGNVKMQIFDSAGNAVLWEAPDTGAASTASVTTTSASCFASDATARERILRNTGASRVGVLFAAATATIANATYIMDPGGTVTTGQDGYTGEIRCISESGTNAVATTKLN